MKLIKQTAPQCTLYSAAMLLNEDPKTLAFEIGHTGLDVLWPTLPKPQCYRGHHIQEIQLCCFRRGGMLALVEPLPVIGSKAGTWPIPVINGLEHSDRLTYMLNGRKGILIGDRHAVAFDDNIIYDPNGLTYSIEDFWIREAWIWVSL